MFLILDVELQSKLSNLALELELPADEQLKLIHCKK